MRGCWPAKEDLNEEGIGLALQSRLKVRGCFRQVGGEVGKSSPSTESGRMSEGQKGGQGYRAGLWRWR